MTRAAGALAIVCLCASAHAQTFVRSETTLATGPNVVAIAVGDLNEDGLPEILTADRGHLSDPHDERPGNDQLSYFVAIEPLKYVAQPQLRAGFGPYALKIVNIDALRAPDIVVVSFLASRNRDLTLFRNLGENLFEPLTFTVPDDDLGYARMSDAAGEPVFTTPGLTSLEVYDFNQDGYRDAVATGWSSDALAYFPGHIENYFAAPRLISLKGGPRDVVRGDFNRDGHQDLAVALHASGEIAILFGDGKGGFEVQSRFDSRGALPSVVRAADFDGDGVLDLVVGHSHGDDSVVIFHGSGDGHFPVSQEMMFGENREAVETGIRDIAVGDFDRNGRPDVAATASVSGQLIVLLTQRGDGFPLKFSEEKYPIRIGKPYAVSVSDLNGDDKLDLVVSVWEANRLELFVQR